MADVIRRLKCDDESDIELKMDMIVCWLIFSRTKWEASSKYVKYYTIYVWIFLSTKTIFFKEISRLNLTVYNL